MAKSSNKTAAPPWPDPYVCIVVLLSGPVWKHAAVIEVKHISMGPFIIKVLSYPHRGSHYKGEMVYSGKTSYDIELAPPIMNLQKIGAFTLMGKLWVYIVSILEKMNNV